MDTFHSTDSNSNFVFERVKRQNSSVDFLIVAGIDLEFSKIIEGYNLLIAEHSPKLYVASRIEWMNDSTHEAMKHFGTKIMMQTLEDDKIEWTRLPLLSSINI